MWIARQGEAMNDLETEAEQLHEIQRLNAHINKLDAEIERLNRYAERLRANAERDANEIERLKVALREISAYPHSEHGGEIARAALEPKP